MKHFKIYRGCQSCYLKTYMLENSLHCKEMETDFQGTHDGGSGGVLFPQSSALEIANATGEWVIPGFPAGFKLPLVPERDAELQDSPDQKKHVVQGTWADPHLDPCS